MPKAFLVISGKGGVGKSIVCANVAVALKRLGYKVGVVDTDIGNPNIPQILKIEGSMEVETEASGIRRLRPYEFDGMQVFSSGLITAVKPISFSGNQTAELLRDVIKFGVWNVDVFCVDLPAGLGDELKASVKVLADMIIGSIIVTQPSHLDEAERVLKLHVINGIPVIGLIENLSYLPCPHEGCQDRHSVFGEPGGTAKLAERYGVEYLGDIPVVIGLRENPILTGDLAKPIEAASKMILDLKPQRPGFLQMVVEKGKEITRGLALNVITTMYKVILKEVNISQLQSQFSYPGGNIIRLNLWDDAFDKTITQADFIVRDGRLRAVTEWETEKAGGPDVRIDAKARALGWAFAGVKKLGDLEVPYGFDDAWFNDDIRVYGEGQSVNALQFFLAVWVEMRKVAPESIVKIVKMLS